MLERRVQSPLNVSASMEIPSLVSAASSVEDFKSTCGRVSFVEHKAMNRTEFSSSIYFEN